MKRVIPNDIFLEKPCSMVAVGCALGLSDSEAVEGLRSADLHNDGYLSLAGMNSLVRANLSVTRVAKFKRGERPVLRDWAHENLGRRAVVCVLGHYLYFDGRDYHSFLWNGGDRVVQVWFLG